MMEAEALTARLADGENDFRRNEVFNQAALEVHAFQRAASPVLRRFWGAAKPSSWEEIPFVPVDAFKDVPIISGTAQVVFRTSGTTGGAARRGEHHVASLELYRAAARANYRRHLFGRGVAGQASTGVTGARPAASEDGSPAAGGDPGPGNASDHGQFQLISLVPDPVVVPDSSLAAMAGFIAQEPEVARTAWAFHPQRGIDMHAVATAVGRGLPVLMLTTAFSLVHLLDRIGAAGLPFADGSRIMETGGFKGRAAEVDRPTLYRRIRDTLGVPESHIVNEYGMTEMLSQAYDGEAGRAPAVQDRVHRFPPWVRTRALEPRDLSPLPSGEPGLLAHFDLANAASVCHILTADMGIVTEDGGVRLLGRAQGAELRGCSLTAEAFLRRTRGP